MAVIAGSRRRFFQVSSERVKKLANLQAMCLKRAMSLPLVDTVVYSTCSRELTENEAVVKEILGWCEALPRHEGTRTYTRAHAYRSLRTTGRGRHFALVRVVVCTT